MGWIAGEEMDVCDSFAEEGMSTFEAARRDGEKWMRWAKVNENEKSSSKKEDE
jgi:hypothetical protein